jgi:mycothione reductase
MESFDILVVGAGSGLNIADDAVSRGLKVAIVESGPMGGTCLNRGCIPSKMLIHAADVAETVKGASRFNVNASFRSVNFSALVRRVSKVVDDDARSIERSIRSGQNPRLFKGTGTFVGDRTMKIGSKTITAKKVFIMAGTRPLIPPITGIQKVKYLTSTEALRLKKLPKSLAIIGGGYIAAELAHFFGSLGTKVTIIQRDMLLIPSEDRDISAAFTTAFKKKHRLLLGYTASAVEKKGKAVVVTAVSGRNTKRVLAEQLLIATGRIPNTDILDVKKAGIRTNKHGHIVVNRFMETSAKNVWAGGDIAGMYFFKHSANLEAQYMSHNAFSKKIPVQYAPMPHAIFSSPQIAGVGKREQDLAPGTYSIGKQYYRDTGMGAALRDETGFVKMIAEKSTGNILGCHIIGPDASTLIHEVVVAMKTGKTDAILGSVHVHPALSEVVQRAAGKAQTS